MVYYLMAQQISSATGMNEMAYSTQLLMIIIIREKNIKPQNWMDTVHLAFNCPIWMPLTGIRDFGQEAELIINMVYFTTDRPLALMQMSSTTHIHTHRQTDTEQIHHVVECYLTSVKLQLLFAMRTRRSICDCRRRINTQITFIRYEASFGLVFAYQPQTACLCTLSLMCASILSTGTLSLTWWLWPTTNRYRFTHSTNQPTIHRVMPAGSCGYIWTRSARAFQSSDKKIMISRLILFVCKKYGIDDCVGSVRHQTATAIIKYRLRIWRLW